jgi:hypothetical protein
MGTGIVESEVFMAREGERGKRKEGKGTSDQRARN